MDFTLTIVASDTPLSAGHLLDISKFCSNSGLMVTGEASWLEPHKAADIPVAECANIEQIKALRTFLAADKIDIFCTRTADRRKKLLIADMDSTIVTTETLDELAAEAGIKDQIATITERAMRGELDFHAALKERVGLLKGLPAAALKRTLDQTEISTGAEKLVKTMRDNGAFCALVSGGFTYFTQAIADQLGFTVHHGNTLEIADDKLTGTVAQPILDKDSKLAFLKKYTQDLEINLGDSIAIGDGANDLPMLQAAGLGIGYHPKPLLEDALVNCIRFTDLTS
ncbi:MAG TPA: phosphoserine phosphatase SerB, partial [Alphaproteobacteria bacterium]|nr:phosphoserine phosphatase SerB [Alphaproteobacteria bacterium]